MRNWFAKLLAALKRLAQVLLNVLIPPPSPPTLGTFGRIQVVEERRSAGSMKVDILKYVVGLPAVTHGGAKNYRLTVDRDLTAAGEFPAQVVADVPLDQTDYVLEAVQGSQVALSIVAVDEAGNTSQPVTTSFTAVDTIPPELTGSFTVTAVDERTVEVADPAPATPVPAPEPTPVVVDEPVAVTPEPIVDAPVVSEEPQTIVTPPTPVEEPVAVVDEPVAVTPEPEAAPVVEDVPAVSEEPTTDVADPEAPADVNG